tara:strand:+ start:178 stop:435 length:258 start_codon:yes stop_codon:yes gene_type:complete
MFNSLIERGEHAYDLGLFNLYYFYEMKQLVNIFYFLLMLVGNISIFSGLGNVFFNEQGVGFDFYVGIFSLIIGGVINYFYWYKRK